MMMHMNEEIILKQKSAYSDLKDLILLTENEIKRDNWAKATQLWQMEAKIRERIVRLNTGKNYASPPPMTPAVKEALIGLNNEAKEVKEKIDAMIRLMNNCLAKERQDRVVLQKTKVTINTYKRDFTPSPRFIQKNF